jgi:monothiol glutaredoxin
MSIDRFIDNEVKGNAVVLFMKGTPQFPMCGFSGQVGQILDNLGIAFQGLNALENDDLRQGIKAYSSWPTIPQLYVKGEFVGCGIIREMFQSGELQSLLKGKGIVTKAQGERLTLSRFFKSRAVAARDANFGGPYEEDHDLCFRLSRTGNPGARGGRILGSAGFIEQALQGHPRDER